MKSEKKKFFDQKLWLLGPFAKLADSKNVKISEKNDFLENFCQENNQEGTQPLKLFVQKS